MYNFRYCKSKKKKYNIYKRSKKVKVKSEGGARMARLSDIIEDFIKELIDENNQNALEIQRNELANHFACAPSQINYVLATRFSVEQGYYIESKRGGGGCIRITRIDIDKNDYLKKAIWKSIGDSITQMEGENVIKLFYERSFITDREAALMRAVINDKTLIVTPEDKGKLRAQLLKNMLIAVVQ